MYAHCRCALLWPVQSIRILSLRTLPPLSFFSSFQYTSLFLYLHILCFTILLMFYYFLFLSLFPQIKLLQKCSTTAFVYDHVCFVYILIFWTYLLCMRENMCLFSFWSWLTSPNMMRSNCIHLPSHPISSFLVAK
jgi:hypothetical protein